MVKGLIDALENTEVDTVLSSEDFKSQSDCGSCFIQLIEKTDEDGYRKTFLVGVCKICGEVCFVSDPPGKKEKLKQYEDEIREDPGHLTRLAKKHCKCRNNCNHESPDPEVKRLWESMKSR